MGSLLIGSRRALLSAPAFDPRSLGSLALWLDAVKHNAADGDAVTTWSDQSGNGKDAVQSVAGAKPSYKTGIQAGKPVIRFDGGDGLTTEAIDLTGTSAVSLYVVCSSSASGAAQIIAEFGTGAAGPGCNVAKNSANVASWFQQGDSGAGEFQSTATLTAMAALAGTYDRTLATNEINGWFNGSNAGSRPSNGNNTNTFGDVAFNVGARNNATSVFLTGDIAEVLFFSVAHTTAQRTLIESYLRQKWGTP